jgi:DNA-binding MarR family transcriptional regulator
MEPKDVIIKALEQSGKPMKGGEIAEATGIDKKDVDKLIKKLVVEGRVDSPVRCFYGLVK